MGMVRWLVILLPLLIIVGLFATPWYSNRYSFWIQILVNYSFWRLPKNYTGEVDYRNMHIRLSHSERLVNGLQDGFTDTYDAHGHRLYHEEWKHGHPWNGICHFWEYKAWTMEYRNGVVWNGAAKSNSIITYHLNGKVVTKQEYCTYHHIPQNANCYAMGWFP